jgi:hypothetical protein
MGLRIAQVSSTFPPYLGGTGNVCYQLARQLVERGHDVQVFTPSDDRNREEVLNGISVSRLRSTFKYGNAHLLAGLVQRLKGFDLIHLHHPFFGGETAAAAAWWSRTPLVITYLSSRDMPVAFSGTATDVAEDTVTLDVDRWYRGGEADSVTLERYDASTASIEGLDITEGDRYLITATGGTVNLCGYSVPWSSQMATAFDEAFGS